ncbi:Ldh family oxidoreductase [Streptomyces sp. NBC_00986]|uniref:Ldh family oxidoreductase n=1 Tax=Streptomyces sp. NBC_00986 TaxID=2903702 RepID=UPI003864453F|nr:Ldh family oxidoreductase [Streptomyces sp. NBC_00986]
MSGTTQEVRFAADELRDFASRVLIAAGATRDAAELCAQVLVHADLGGTDTHGIVRLGQYAQALADGRVSPLARPQVVSDAGPVAVVDAGNALGPVGLSFAVDHAVSAARRHGVTVVTVRGSNHAGSMSWYTARAAEAGLVALVLTGSTKAMVAPSGGAAAFLGTNAVAYAVPAGEETVSFDAATSSASRSMLETFQRAGQCLPQGWAQDGDGRPALDAGEVIAGIDQLSGHSLLPFGGPENAHKGFGVGLLVELLCGPIAGAGWGPRLPGAGPANVGHFVLCLDPGALDADAADVQQRVRSLGAQLRAVPPPAGSPPVRVPGDRQRRCAAQRAHEGIPLPTQVRAELDHTAALVGVSPPVPLHPPTTGRTRPARATSGPAALTVTRTGDNHGR